MKTTKMNPCSDDKFIDIPNLKFYRTDADLFYFDATNLLKDCPPQEGLGIEAFFKAFSYLIDAIKERNDLGEDDLHVSDDTGKEYLEECLVIPFLAYVDRRFGPYMVERMEELMRFGFSINDNMAQFFYKTRFDQ